MFLLSSPYLLGCPSTECFRPAQGAGVPLDNLISDLIVRRQFLKEGDEVAAVSLLYSNTSFSAEMHGPSLFIWLRYFLNLMRSQSLKHVGVYLFQYFGPIRDPGLILGVPDD